MLKFSKYKVRIGECVLTQEFVTDYREVVAESTFDDSYLQICSLTAVLGRVLGMLLKYFELPPGTVHLSQEIKSSNYVRAGESIIVWAKASRALRRREWTFQSIEFTVMRGGQGQIMSGKTSVMVPFDG